MPPRKPPRRPANRLVLNVLPEWTVGLVIAHALEGLPGYDGATLADLEKLDFRGPSGTLPIPETDDPLEAVRNLMGVLAPGYSLTKDEGGSLRVQSSGPGRTAETSEPATPKPEASDDGAA